MALNSNELNLLVYRYLLESGFAHAAFTFGYEAMVHRNAFSEKDVPPASLINFVQKGLQYIELETNLSEDGSKMDGDFMGLSKLDLITKSTDQLRQIVRERRERREQQRKEREERMAQVRLTPEEREAGPRVIPDSHAQILEGHGGEVFNCCWNPHANLLASAAGDRTARIWDFSSKQSTPVELHHPLKKERDVTTLGWSPEGQYLATGAYDGIARIWTKDGICQHTLTGHSGPIFSLRWNKRGDLLLTGSVDKSAIVWNVKTGKFVQQFSFHSAPALDVDWKNNTTFATSSTDKTIYVCKVGEELPLKSFLGHTSEVNCVKWDPQGNLLVSCSDDTTAKVWTLSQDTCIFDLRLHQKEIYTTKWRPAGPGTANPNLPLLLATASFDSSIRLWEMERGTCLQHLTGHIQPIYSISFSPDGLFLASGSFETAIRVWGVTAGNLIAMHEASGGFFEVCWNKDGEMLAACSKNKTLTVIDIRSCL